MTNTYTEAEALSHHGIEVGVFSADAARAAGLIYACLGCGTVGGVSEGTPESARAATRDALDWDSLCCEDSTQIIY